MAHTLQLTLGGSTIDLNSGSYSMIEYVPQSPNLSTIDTNSILVDGGKRTLTSRRNVTEVASIRFANTNKVTLQDQKQLIQNWLIYAERGNETDGGSPLYVNYAPDGTSGSIYRSEIFGGKVNLDTDSLNFQWTGASSLSMNIVWSRKYYWEGDQITLSTHNADGHSTCPTVWNHNIGDFTGAASPNNWLQIDASAINAGEIPSPPIIEIENDCGSSISAPTCHIFYNRLSSPTGLPHMIQAETNEYGTASTVGSANCSSGSYSKTNLYAEDTETQLYQFTIPSASFAKMGGNYFDIIGRFFHTTSTASTFLKAKLYINGLTPVFESQSSEMDEDTEIQSFGLVKMPPISTRLTDYVDLRLDLIFERSACTSYNLDYVQISPVDGHRVLRSIAWDVDDGDLIVDDGELDFAYQTSDNVGSDKAGIYTTEGQPVHLWPNENQRLYFLIDSSSIAVGTDILFTTKVRIKYRPRRLSI